LLVLKTSIHRQQYVKSGSFRRCEKFAIFDSAEACESRRLALVPG